MNNTINDLKDKAEGLRDEVRNLLDLAKKDGNRSFNADEAKKFDSLESELKDLDAQIEARQKQLDAEAKYAKKVAIDRANTKTDIQKAAENFSLTKAIREHTNGKLSGVEAEMHQEARVENSNVSGLGIPAKLVTSQRTTLTAGTAATAGNLIQTSLTGSVIAALQPNPIVQQMGATIYDNLTGQLDLPKETAGSTATWEGEVDENAESNQTFGLIQPRAKRLGAFTKITKTLLAQTGLTSDITVANSIRQAIDRAIDSAAINGSGVDPIPEGILNASGIGSVVGGTNGATPTFADMVALESELANDNADFNRLGYLMTPGLRGYLKGLPIDAGSGIMTWRGSEVNGYNAMVSTLVPSNLDKGTSTGVCHAAIFGNWADLAIFRWAGYDIVVDPYSLATQATLKVVVNAWADVKLLHAESFAAMKDALIA